ncbi:tenascin-X-like isoform X2 [Corticium candelabrum]|nr:tenascin-X-like isoform X2 [Corticium candelabrum]
MLERQYIDTEMGLVESFLGQTEGLCGNMDNNMENDLGSPDGRQLSNTTIFAESWRVDMSVSNRGDGSWSWSYSNFHPDDPLDFSYTNPYHRTVYGTEQLNDTKRMEAERECVGLRLQGKLLNDCIIDFALTGDKTVLEQQAFQQGKCPNDCSNRGRCSNKSCICIDSWMGEDCSLGGCDNCPSNSECVDGFCKCNFGYFGKNCLKATCEMVNNCTTATHGRCKSPNVCQCNAGYLGNDCSMLASCTHNCSYRGTCVGDNECLCYFGWGGNSCTKQTCENFAYCSGHGTCRSDGTCECNAGWQGSSCDLSSCDDVGDCSGHGDCIEVNKCSCHVGYTGLTCNISASCPSKQNCSDNGICIDSDTCICYAGYFGNECEAFECSRGCSGRGTCEAPDICSCILGWTGYDCSIPSCEQLHYCSGNGKCVGPGTCQCDDGWGGAMCNDFDCSSGSRSGDCSLNGNCASPGMCACNSNYCGNDCQYQITNECVETATNGTVTSLCDQLCIDTCESYECACSVGYVLDNDGRTCQDVDECNETFAIRLHYCESVCVNILGSYYCNCSVGYQYSHDKQLCVDVDECGVSDRCSQKCTNTVGSYKCGCKSGYRLNRNQVDCDDIDECTENRHDCSGVCNNTLGSFRCGCTNEFLLEQDGKTCTELPFASSNEFLIGATQAVLASTTSGEFNNHRSDFYGNVTREVWTYCQRSTDAQCANLTRSTTSNFYVRVASTIPSKTSLTLTFYVFAIEGSTDAMTIIPADEVVSALNDGHVLEKAGYRVLSLTARFQPSTETPTAISTGSDSQQLNEWKIAVILLSAVLMCVCITLVWFCCCKKKCISRANDSESLKCVNVAYNATMEEVKAVEPPVHYEAID